MARDHWGDDWESRAIEWEHEQRGKRHLEVLSRTAKAAEEFEKKGFKIVDDPDVVVNGVLIVIGYVLEDAKGRKFFNVRNSNKIEPFYGLFGKRRLTKRIEDLKKSIEDDLDDPRSDDRFYR